MISGENSQQGRIPMASTALGCGSGGNDMMIAPVTFPFVAAGEILIDMISLNAAAGLAASTSFGKFFGGAPANVAVNMQRLGVNSTIISRVGNDGLGTFLIDSLAEHRVDTSHVSRDNEYPTSMAVITSGTETAEFVIYRQADTRLARADISDQLLAGCRIFHTAAHGIARRPARDAILDAYIFVHKLGLITSFEPNYSDRYWPDRVDAMATLSKFLAHTVFTKPSDDDAERIFGPGTPEQQIARFHDAGARNVILTRGAKGAILSTPEGQREYPAAPVSDIVGFTGAGDAFTAGFFAAYLMGGDTDKAIHAGLKAAAFKLGYPGAIAPLPPLETLL